MSAAVRLFVLAVLTVMYVVIPSPARAQLAKDSIWDADVKSVFLTLNDVEMQAPQIHLWTDDRLMLRFDVLTDQLDDYKYRIRHCDAEWRVDDLEPYDYLQGFEEGYIENHQFAFTTMQMFVNYYQTIPSDNTSFTASGNYLLEVFPSDEPDSIILTRRFVVYEDLVLPRISIGSPTTSFGSYTRDQEVNVEVTPKEGTLITLQPSYLKVIVQQNDRTDMVHQLVYNGYLGDALMYRWKEENVFPGGNTFRYFDISNIRSTMYHVQKIESFGGETFAFLKPDEDRSRKNYVDEKSSMGHSVIKAVNARNNHTQSDYVWVNFSLPMSQPFMDGYVYVVGDFTQWLLNDESRMEWNPSIRAYTKRLHLKQGYYSYQLLFRRIGESEARTATIEGDHTETNNIYTAYVYLRIPNGRYDRLVGINKAQR